MGGTGDAGHGDALQVGSACGREGGLPDEQPQGDDPREADSGEGERSDAGAADEEEPIVGEVALYTNNDFNRERPLAADTAKWRRAASIDYARVLHSASFRRLQGKTQIFPGHESDFFRNRLTHSLEVAQIAAGIAEKLNDQHPNAFGDDLIDEKLCANAALMHDLGHPPFGHNGERALDHLMRTFGGFEGNAQSLRIVAKLEKKVYKKRDASDNSTIDVSERRLGLNLSYRSLASILKYDKPIPFVRPKRPKKAKGYYYSEKDLVERIKLAVNPDWKAGDDFKTLECSIMDLADDIAYSTYDLEDCLKAGFLTPAIIMSTNDSILDLVARKVGEELGTPFTRGKVLDVFDTIFSDFITIDALPVEDNTELAKRLHQLQQIVRFNRGSRALADDSHERMQLSSDLVHIAIKNVRLKIDQKCPALSRVELTGDAKIQVEVLKQYTYTTTIDSPRIKVAEFRGYEVVKDIFKALASRKGLVLMPPDLRELYEASEDISHKMRAICDFVAGMTDRYAIEFYARLHSDSAQSMFKPL